jgi:hypothetical protein
LLIYKILLVKYLKVLAQSYCQRLLSAAEMMPMVLGNRHHQRQADAGLDLRQRFGFVRVRLVWRNLQKKV